MSISHALQGEPASGELNPNGLEPLFSVVGQAVDDGATDVHIDAAADQAALRFRVDGVIQAKERLSPAQARRLLNQIRVAARFPMEAAFVPLEGQFRWCNERTARDVRVTVVPTFGRQESAHLRLLLPLEHWRETSQLGLRPRDLERIESVVRKPHGLALVAGPTGSGKTTTLYALAGLDNLRRKVCASIEDPVEFELPFVRQLEVNERRGLTMAEGLRTLLRTDADVLLIGEIRDAESARTAAQAALAGRLVLASIHGRDAAGAIQAMSYLCVPYPILGGALRLVVAQGLVRKLCRACRRLWRPDDAQQRLFQEAGYAWPETIYEPHGCAECGHSGYAGRTGVFEVGVVDEETGRWLTAGPHQHEVRARLLQQGMQPLTADALQKATDGVTSLVEIVRFFADLEPAAAAHPPEAAQVAGNGAAELGAATACLPIARSP